MENRYKLERIDNKVQLIQLYADGFEELTVQQRILVYYLYQAAVAGRDITCDQSHPHALVTRNLFEDIIITIDKLEKDNKILIDYKDDIKEIEKYLYYFWIGNGPFDIYTSAKITLQCKKERLIELIRLLGLDSSSIIPLIEKIETFLYDKNNKKILTEKSPGKDWVKESSVNFYDQSLTYLEVQQFIKNTELDKYQINSTLVRKDDGEVGVEVWRAGSIDRGIAPGRYEKELNAVIHNLRFAIPYAESPIQQGSIEKLIIYLESGEAKDFHDFNVHWVGDDGAIDFILGFIEVYTDPFGLRGQYEGCVYWKHESLTRSISQIGHNANYFEQLMPWDDKYKKPDVKPLSLSVVTVVCGVGGMGPSCTLGVNLPNEEIIREQHGSKSIVLQNIAQAADEGMGGALASEFCWDEEELRLCLEYGTEADNIATALHEALGHASGKTYVADPSAALPGYYSTLEEARADLVALYHIFDEKLVELGIVKGEHIGRTLYQQEIRNALLLQLRKVDGDRLEEDHMKNRQLIAKYIYVNSNAIERRERDNKTYFVIVDYKEAHNMVGILLSEIMRIKAEGDLEAARALVDTFGLYVDVDLLEQVKHRVQSLSIPSYAAFVMPTLTPILDSNQSIQDISISHTKDFKAQQLFLSNKLN